MNLRLPSRSILVWLMTVSPLSGQFVVVPNGLFSVDGNSYEWIPFLIRQTGMPSIRYQQVYAASDFSTVAPSGAYLTRLFIRSDAEFPAWVLSTNLMITVSTTSRSPDDLSLIFAENIGPDETVLYGPDGIDISGGGFSSMEFGITNAFWYSPAAGNLLLDVRIHGGESPQPIDVGVDAHDVEGDAVSRVYATTVDSASATHVDSLGLVTGFSFYPIPALTNMLATNGVVLTWPVQPKVFSLQWSDRLVPDSAWRAYTNEIGGNAGFHVLTISFDELHSAQFFRLACGSCPPIPQEPSLNSAVRRRSADEPD